MEVIVCVVQAMFKFRETLIIESVKKKIIIERENFCHFPLFSAVIITDMIGNKSKKS